MEDLRKYIDDEGRAVLPDSISEICEEAFKDCENLSVC